LRRPDSASITEKTAAPLQPARRARGRAELTAGRVEPHLLQQGRHLRPVKFEKLPAPQTGRQPQAAVTHADEARDHEPHRLEKAPHFPFASFANHHVVPVVGPFPATILDVFQAGRLPVDLHARQKPLHLFGAKTPHHPHGVFPLHLVAGMHEPVGKLP
jgi:hypothetical protein